MDNIPTNYAGSVYPTDDPTETYYNESLQNLNFVGNDNMFAGNGALASIENGFDNVALGVNTLTQVTNSDNNIAIGSRALRIATGGNNICIGANAGQNITTGDGNIVINSSGLGDAIVTGSNNILLGVNSSLHVPGLNDCILLGRNAATLAGAGDNGNNQFVINNVVLDAGPEGITAWGGGPTSYLQVVLNGAISYIPVFIPQAGG
jgi:hypothetical protein